MNAIGVHAQVSATSETVTVEVAPGPLKTSIVELGKQLRVDIFASADLVQARTAPAVSGTLTAEAALSQLLLGSGLVATHLEGGGFVIKRETASGVKAPRLVENVVVVGVKQPINLQNTVESVEVFSGQRFDQESLFNIADALARTPNVSVIGDGLINVSIRGIDRQGTNSAGQGTAINVFQDGMPLNRDALLFSTSSSWDIEQLEVLRGSQSTVNGRNSIAGAIVVQSKKPTFDWEGTARVRAAEFGEVQTAAAISGPLIRDQLAFRLSVDHQESEGFIEDALSGDDRGSRDNLSVRGRFLIEPEAVPGLSALLSVEYVEQSAGGFVGQQVQSERGDLDFDPQARRTFAPIISDYDFEAWRYFADVSYEISDTLTLKLLGTYEDSDNRRFDTDRTTNQFSTLGTADDNTRDIYSAEARLEFDFGKLTGFAGVFYYLAEDDGIRSDTLEVARAIPFPLDPPDTTLTLTSLTRGEVENLAAFTAWRYNPNEKWTFDVSLRYDDEQFETQNSSGDFLVAPESCVITVPGAIVGQTGIVTLPCTQVAPALLPPSEPLQSDSLGVWLPSGAITYHLTDHASLFVGYRRGYRAGGTFLSNALESSDLFQVVTYDPEFLDTYEAGWRSQWLGRRLSVNGTLFYSEYEDQQVSFRDAEGFTVIDNAGATSLYGLELSMNYAATSDLSVFASVGLLETNVDEFLFQFDNPDTPDNEFIDLSGNELERSPPLSFNVGVNYRAPGGFFAGASVAYQDEYYSSVFNVDEELLGNGLTEEIDAAAIVNAQVGYAFSDRLTLTAYATNLFDEGSSQDTFINGLLSLLGDNDLSDNILFYRIRQPQTFGITVDLQF
ncbi:MAG: TonB-dependent receptor [Pseudomonadota bacterium]